MSLEPGKIILELKICIQGRPTLSRQSRPFKGLASTVEDFAGSTYRPFCWRETFKPRPTYDLGDFYGFCKGGEKEWPKTHHETNFRQIFYTSSLYTQNKQKVSKNAKLFSFSFKTENSSGNDAYRCCGWFRLGWSEYLAELAAVHQRRQSQHLADLEARTSPL